jgi:uncharacterized protein
MTVEIMTTIESVYGPWVDSANGPRLQGSRCANCATYAFPARSSCQRCAGEQTELVLLSRSGRLWTFTVQGFPPNSPPYLGNNDPKTFAPFAVGYVELEGQLKVEARLTESDPNKLHIGMALELVILPIEAAARSSNDPTQAPMMFAFAPQKDL